MSAEETHRDLIRALELAADLSAGVGWYDVEDTRKELNALRCKYHIKGYEMEDEDMQDSTETPQ